MKAEGVVVFNKFGAIGAGFDQKVNAAIRTQIYATQRDTQTNIQKYGLIDTGTMLNSVTPQMTGQFSGEVKVSAQSDEGYPYPAAQNYGTRYIPASPFFSEAVTKAEGDFPKRFDNLF